MIIRFLPDRKILKWCWIALDAFFLPLTILVACGEEMPTFLLYIIGTLLSLTGIASIMLRILFIPHILAVLLLILSIIQLIKDFRNREFLKRKLLLLLLGIIICAANLWALEIAFWGNISV